MWNDEIIEAIRGCTEPMLDLRDIGLEMYQLGTLERRRAAIQSVIQHFKRTPPARRSEAVAAVVAKAGGDVRRDLMMTPAQVKSLSERGMEVGAHTVSHPILTQLCLDEARREITNSKRCLESITAEPVRLFAYPNGSPGEDYTAEHVSLVRSLGFDAAVSTAPGSARLNGDLFQLARVRPGRRRGLRFIGKLVKDAFTLPPSYA
jgi:peptidoglycan/xylan/chitin deacetylase (PgdA/CDA1 family)